MDQRLAVVTGSSGHIGGWVARTLLDDGWVVRGVDVARNPHRFRSESFHEVVADVRDERAVTETVEDADAVFNLAMVHVQHLQGERAERELTDVAVEGLETLLRAVRKSGKPTRLVHTSTAGAVGETEDPLRPPDETQWNPDPITPYTKAKIAAERHLWAEGEDVDAVAVLPAMTIGPNDPGEGASNRRIEQMYRQARMPIWFRGGLNIVDVRDIARGQIQAYERGSRGERYLLGGADLEFRDLMLQLRRLRRLGGEPRIPAAAPPARDRRRCLRAPFPSPRGQALRHRPPDREAHRLLRLCRQQQGSPRARLYDSTRARDARGPRPVVGRRGQAAGSAEPLRGTAPEYPRRDLAALGAGSRSLACVFVRVWRRPERASMLAT